MPAGNLLASAATLFCGQTYTHIAQFAEFMNLKFITESTFTTIQREFLSGGSRGGEGGTPGARPPKIGKNTIFWRKIVIFHTKYQKKFRASLRNWKKYFFWA